jgi:hypothetical protein
VLFACFGKFSLTLGKLALQSVMSCSGLVNVLSGLALSRLLGTDPPGRSYRDRRGSP